MQNPIAAHRLPRHHPTAMRSPPPPFTFLVAVGGGWWNERQQCDVEFVCEETRVLRQRLRKKRLRLTDDERGRRTASDDPRLRQRLATNSKLLTKGEVLNGEISTAPQCGAKKGGRAALRPRRRAKKWGTG